MKILAWSAFSILGTILAVSAQGVTIEYDVFIQPMVDKIIENNGADHSVVIKDKNGNVISNCGFESNNESNSSSSGSSPSDSTQRDHDWGPS